MSKKIREASDEALQAAYNNPELSPAARQAAMDELIRRSNEGYEYLDPEKYQPDLATGWLADTPEEVQAAVLGAGRTIDKGVAGFQDLALAMGQGGGGPEEDYRRAMYGAPVADVAAARADIAQEQAAADQAYTPLQREYPVATAVGGALPYLATAPLSGGLATQAGIGFGLDAMQYQPDMGDRAIAGLTGAGFSALPFGAGRAWRGLRGTPDDAFPPLLADQAQALGFPLTPGQQSGSRFLRGVEAGMESTPFTSGAVHRVADQQQAAVNRAAAEALGETTEDLAEGCLARAVDRIGKEFDELIKGRTFPVDDEFLSRVGDIEEASRRGVLGGVTLEKPVERILEEASGGSITGKTLQRWRTTLQTEADKAWRSDVVTADYAKGLDDLVDAVDGLISRNMDGPQRARWKTARDQWSTLKNLERSQAIDEFGDVSGRKLGNYLSRTDASYRRGGIGPNASPLEIVTKASRAAKPLPDSGTATRLSLPGGILAAGIAGVFPPAVPIAGATHLLGRAYMNPAVQHAALGAADAAGAAAPAATRFAQGLFDAPSRAAGMTDTIFPEDAMLTDDEPQISTFEEDIESFRGAAVNVLGQDEGDRITNESYAVNDWIDQWREDNPRDYTQQERRTASRELIEILRGEGVSAGQAARLADSITGVRSARSSGNGYLIEEDDGSRYEPVDSYQERQRASSTRYANEMDEKIAFWTGGMR